jgi:flagella basal body P-ring formation protein FlgA
MKCSKKSTRWFVEALAAAAIAIAGVGSAGAASIAEPCVPGVSRAIVTALKLRMSGAVEFHLAGVSCAVEGDAGDLLIATPAPGARMGHAIRFAISRRSSGPHAENRRVGEAFATVTAEGAAVRATRDIPRATVLSAADVVEADGPLDDAAVRRVLSLAETVGARATRPLRAGQIVDAQSVVEVPAIRSGDRVRAVIRAGGIEVETIVVAADGGAVDQIIQVVNPETRRTMRARVRGKGEVEVIGGR